jgi:hypothetical protein
MILQADQTVSWKKHGVILEPDEIPGRINNMSGASIPLGDGRWRIWYDYTENKHRHIAFSEGDPLKGRMTRTTATIGEEATAKGGLIIRNVSPNWNPRHPCHLSLKDGRKRLYFWTTAQGVIRYLSADSEDGRCFVVNDPNQPCFYHPHDRAVAPNDAPPGLTLCSNIRAERPAYESLAAPHLVVNDATNVYQLADGSFEAYSARVEKMPENDPGYVSYDNAAGYRRFIRRFTSSDGLTWQGPFGEIRPDENDPQDLQFYYFSVTHTPQGRVGLLGYYRCADQTIDVEICFSDDGINWKRPMRGAWLQRGKKEDPDGYAIMASHSLSHWNDRWWLFYTGYNFSHNHRESFGPEMSRILCAEIDAIPHGFDKR